MENNNNLPLNEQESLKELTPEQKSNRQLAERLFPEDLPSIESLLTRYPDRELPKGAMVTRIAPSPTGFMHIGGMYMALISCRLAHQTNGVYYLRIEDTDQKREVEGARKVVTDSLHKFGLDPDEGEGINGVEKGAYGPYRQSERKDIYKSFIKHLVEIGRAYPCFCSEEELEATHKKQEELNVKSGYYGVWAKYRNADPNIVEEMLNQGKPYIIRFKSLGSNENKIVYNDLLKGQIELPENDLDLVILKSDGLPTYHFAHVIDDHLMGTTHVLRGDEWLSSIPLHRELFKAFEFKCPEYAHIAPINKIDESGGKRKLSKRKDPEANISFFGENGYPEVAVVEYLMNLANSNFEDWRKANPDKLYTEFQLALKKLPDSAGPLFDRVKLNDIAKEKIAGMKAEDLYAKVLDWSSKYDPDFKEILEKDPEYWIKVFSIDRGGNKSRKDITMWSEVKEISAFFNKDRFIEPDWSSFTSKLNTDEIKSIISQYDLVFSLDDSSDKWMEKIKQIAVNFGFAPDTKTYKKNKESFRGHVGEVAQIIRFAITGRTQTPDLYQIMQVLGEEECRKRLTLI